MLHVCVIHDGKQVDLQGAQRDVLFHLADGDIQPTMGVCHALAWKAAESFTLQLPAPFRYFSLEWCSCVYIWAWTFSSREKKKKEELGCRKYPLSSDGGWWMELSEGSEWWKKTSSLVSLSLSLCVNVLRLLLVVLLFYTWCWPLRFNHWKHSRRAIRLWLSRRWTFQLNGRQIKNVAVRAPWMDPRGDLGTSVAVIWKQPWPI